jgi:hypothetical protein
MMRQQTRSGQPRGPGRRPAGRSDDVSEALVSVDRRLTTIEE